MTRKAGAIDEIRFSTGSLTADSDGLFSIFSEIPINGTIQNIRLGSNTYTNTGSILFFISGTNNGVNNDGLILKLRAGSGQINTVYPVREVTNFTGIVPGAGSLMYVRNVLNAPIRIVGSGLGDSTSSDVIAVSFI